jgi:hypothetical protein
VDQVRNWWAQWPDANVAIATGSGLVVLDVDPYKGGLHSLSILLGGGFEWPTATVRTGSGGLHFYFTVDQSVRNATGFQGLLGIDVRGDGGYVVAPPSNHLKGLYQWRIDRGFNGQIAEWPFLIGDRGKIPSPANRGAQPTRFERASVTTLFSDSLVRCGGQE